MIPKRLDFDLSCSLLTKTDGRIEFAIPNGVVDSFDTVDDSKLHTLYTRLTYNFCKGYYFVLGCYGERFDHDDYKKQGFTNVPTDVGRCVQRRPARQLTLGAL